MPGVAPTVGTGLSYTPHAVTIMDLLVKGGLTPTAAAGVVGNLMQESSLNPAESGGGLAQWGGSRLTAEQAYARAHGQSPTSLQASVGYILDELHGGPGAAENDSSVLTAINQAKTPGQAATIFSQRYERPGTPMLANRIKYAEQAASAYSTSKSTGVIGTIGGAIGGVGNDIGHAANHVINSLNPAKAISDAWNSAVHDAKYAAILVGVLALGVMLIYRAFAGGHHDSGQSALASLIGGAPGASRGAPMVIPE